MRREIEMVGLDRQTKIIHVDMDYFFAQVEILDNPALKGKPVVISGPPNSRSVVGTASYEAREFGVHSGMSANDAHRLCPQAIFVEYHFEKYQAISKQMQEIFQRYSDIIEPLSLDEAYIDVTNNKLKETSAIKIARMIQNDILQELNLTCSIGVSYNKFLAKIGSDYNKPYGITVITPDQAADFIAKLPIRKFPGVGKKSVTSFYQYAIYYGSDLLQYSRDDLIRMFKKRGEILYDRARGIDERKLVVNRIAKSIGAENTFLDDIYGEREALIRLDKIADKVELRLNKKQMSGRTVTLKVKYASFEQITRSKTVGYPISDKKTVLDIINELCQVVDLQRPIRLLGISVSGLDSGKQLKNVLRYEQILLDVFKKE